jgi:hypothetical protein
MGEGPLFSCFIAFLCYNVSKSFVGVHEVPLSPSPPLCISMHTHMYVMFVPDPVRRTV